MTQQYNALGGLQLGVDRIATSPTAYALYENPLAMFRGAPSAPRLSPWATVAVVAAGDGLRYNDQGPFVGVDSDDLHPVRSVTVFCKGVLRVEAQTIRPSAGTTRARVQRVRGLALEGLPAGLWEHTQGSSDTTKPWTVDIDVEPGDALQLVARNSGGVQPRLGYFRLRTSAAYFWAIGGGSLVVGPEPE